MITLLLPLLLLACGVSRGLAGAFNSGIDDAVSSYRQMCHGGFQNVEQQRLESDILLEENSKDPSVANINRKVQVWPGAKMLEPYPLLCVMYTHAKKHVAAAKMHRVWGQRCDRQIFITNVEVIEGVDKDNVFKVIPDGGESYENMWQKTRSTMKLLASLEWVNDYDFIFFGGDDAFLIPENLRKLMSEPEVMTLHEAGTPLLFGYRQIVRQYSGKRMLPDVNGPDFISGAGYVLNLVALKITGNLMMDDVRCKPNVHQSFEDVYLAECLSHVGVYPRDVRDVHGEDRFIILAPIHMQEQAKNSDYSWWWRDYRDRQLPNGLDIVSRDTILFHYVYHQDILPQLALAIYNMRI